jgi:hypothetical protein
VKQLFLFAILTISIASYAESSKWMLNNFLGLNNSDSSVREKSAYGLKGYYTDNGAEPSQEYLDLLQSNADHLLNTLSDENLRTRYYITELVAARRISQHPKPSIVFVSLLEDEKIRLFKAKFLNNLNSGRELLVISSINALINLKTCEHLPEMLFRAEELSEYERKYAIASMDRLQDYCGK